MPVIGVAKAGWNLDQLRERAHDSLEKHGGVDPAAFAQLRGLLRYIDGDYQDPATWNALRQELNGAQRAAYYLAIPPVLFETVVEQLVSSGCAGGARHPRKPFRAGPRIGARSQRDLTRKFVNPTSSASIITSKTASKQYARLSVREYFRRSVLEFHHHIESVQITMAEDFGVQGRAHSHDQTGTVATWVQNHLFQILSMWRWSRR